MSGAGLTGSRTRRLAGAALAAALLFSSAAYVSAQFGRGFRIGVRFAPHEMPDRSFTVCRIMYQSVRREADGAGWQTDYPLGENNLLIRLSELTKTRVSKDGGQRPNHWVVRLTDDALFNCPYTVASDVGTMGLSPEEVLRLRTYLLKGGFLWVDDFWGEAAWEQWASELGKAMPPDEFPIEEVALSDPIFHVMTEVTAVPQVPSIRFWRGSGGGTSERGAESAVPRLKAIRDTHQRIVVVMTHNTDMSDSFEREGEDPRFFAQFSPNGYALGINVLLYSLTH